MHEIHIALFESSITGFSSGTYLIAHLRFSELARLTGSNVSLGVDGLASPQLSFITFLFSFSTVY